MTLTLEQQIAAAALKAAGAEEVYVFGSARTGEITDKSDLDLAVRGLPDRVFYAAAAAASDASDRDVDLIDLDSSHPIVEYLRSTGAFLRVA